MGNKEMKTVFKCHGTAFAALALALLAVCGGCRREDMRTAIIDIPGLTEANKPKIVEAFKIAKPGQKPHVYDGIDTDNFVFDFEKKTLTLQYDSMKIAKTNIRMLIQGAGVEVTFPSNTNGVAGYLDRKVADDIR